jgi:hypothetical protein
MAGGMLLLACPQDFYPGRPFSPGTTGSGTTIFHSAGTAGGPGYGTGTAGGATGTTAGSSGSATLFHGAPRRCDSGHPPRPSPPRDGHRVRLGDRRQVRRCPPAERTPRCGRRPASASAAVAGFRRRCPATPDVRRVGSPDLLLSLPEGCAVFVVRRCRFRCFPTPSIPLDRAGYSALRAECFCGVIAIFVVFPVP